MNRNFDLIIVGNGILGYSLAFETAKQNPHLKIAVIGLLHREGSASIAAGAMLNAFAEVTSKALTSKPSRKKLEMAIQASKLWPNWVEELNSRLPKQHHTKIQNGTFVILNTDSGKLDDENFNSIITALKQFDEPYEESYGTDIPGINPRQRARSTRALYIPNEGSISPTRIINALHIILEQQMNVAFIDDMVTGITIKSGKVTALQTASGLNYSCDKIALANGFYAQGIINKIPEIRHDIPMILSGVGYSLLLKNVDVTPIQHVIRSPNRSGACGLHALPRDHQTLYVGASNNISTTPSTTLTLGLINFLIECSIEQINHEFYKSQILGWQVGNRPAPIDTFPLIGRTSIQGLWLLTGIYRDGFHQSPLLASNMAKDILDQPHELPTMFKPERPLLQIRTREESIEEFLQHFIAGTYEHYTKLPKFLSDQEFLSLIRPKVEYWYEQLDTEFNMSPDMLLMFNFASNPQEQLEEFKTYFKRTKVSDISYSTPL